MPDQSWKLFQATFLGLSGVSFVGGLIWLASGFSWWGFVLALGGGLLLVGGVLLKALRRRRASRD
jgi:hypothetical protein